MSLGKLFLAFCLDNLGAIAAVIAGGEQVPSSGLPKPGSVAAASECPSNEVFNAIEAYLKEVRNQEISRPLSEEACVYMLQEYRDEISSVHGNHLFVHREDSPDHLATILGDPNLARKYRADRTHELKSRPGRCHGNDLPAISTPPDGDCRADLCFLDYDLVFLYGAEEGYKMVIKDWCLSAVRLALQKLFEYDPPALAALAMPGLTKTVDTWTDAQVALVKNKLATPKKFYKLNAPRGSIGANSPFVTFHATHPELEALVGTDRAWQLIQSRRKSVWKHFAPFRNADEMLNGVECKNVPCLVSRVREDTESTRILLGKVNKRTIKDDLYFLMGKEEAERALSKELMLADDALIAPKEHLAPISQ